MHCKYTYVLYLAPCTKSLIPRLCDFSLLLHSPFANYPLSCNSDFVSKFEQITSACYSTAILFKGMSKQKDYPALWFRASSTVQCENVAVADVTTLFSFRKVVDMTPARGLRETTFCEVLQGKCSKLNSLTTGSQCHNNG